MTDQLVFQWPSNEALRAEDFFVSQSNETAVAMLRAPETWPENKLVLVGPEGCGKSHLARIFENENDARRLDAHNIPDMPDTTYPVIVENADRLPKNKEEALFHLHNALRATEQSFLLTARTAPARWNVALPDLASRLQATTPVHIDDPDDTLLRVLLTKLFSDRQIMPTPTVINYIATHMDRSYAAANQIVEALDKKALTLRTPISIKMVRGLLDN